MSRTPLALLALAAFSGCADNLEPPADEPAVPVVVEPQPEPEPEPEPARLLDIDVLTPSRLIIDSSLTLLVHDARGTLISRTVADFDTRVTLRVPVGGSVTDARFSSFLRRSFFFTVAGIATADEIDLRALSLSAPAPGTSFTAAGAPADSLFFAVASPCGGSEPRRVPLTIEVAPDCLGTGFAMALPSRQVTEFVVGDSPSIVGGPAWASLPRHQVALRGLPAGETTYASQVRIAGLALPATAEQPIAADGLVTAESLDSFAVDATVVERVTASSGEHTRSQTFEASDARAPAAAHDLALLPELSSARRGTEIQWAMTDEPDAPPTFAALELGSHWTAIVIAPGARGSFAVPRDLAGAIDDDAIVTLYALDLPASIVQGLPRLMLAAVDELGTFAPQRSTSTRVLDP